MSSTNWKGKTPEDGHGNEQQRLVRQKRRDAQVGDEIVDQYSTTSHSATLLDNADYSINDSDKLELSQEASDRHEQTPPSHNIQSTMNQNELQTDVNTPKTSTSKFTNPIWKFLSRIAVDLDNVGSVARDHLANERTWLAYVRTSLAIAGTGVALVQLFTISINDDTSRNKNSLQRAARPLGATTVIIGAIVLCIGIFRYFHVQKSMIRGHFPLARTSVIIISTIMATLAAIIFGFLLGFKD
ncbi:hypothetical protein Clacol_001356 [Clathrus columnatus]|uniref:DUF202 domain-containing protein n=1 Tax=Clathrus columnatus TaxID=1419009 RepID=A0AAV4ZY30_9AGAM|nr:hypothetical protein Clacol_001356 [Clathrus columnatus]